MPIITVSVPSSIKDGDLVRLREEIKSAVATEYGISPKNITVEFPEVRVPERILVKFETRSGDFYGEMLYDVAKFVGRIVEIWLRIKVESLAVWLNRDETGIYLT